MSSLRVAFFDEPTANLDPERRAQLATHITNIQGFDQVFVISHDDTFESSTANPIRLQKQRGATQLAAD
jgi:exonuclease SbcC